MCLCGHNMCMLHFFPLATQRTYTELVLRRLDDHTEIFTVINISHPDQATVGMVSKSLNHCLVRSACKCRSIVFAFLTRSACKCRSIVFAFLIFFF